MARKLWQYQAEAKYLEDFPVIESDAFVLSDDRTVSRRRSWHGDETFAAPDDGGATAAVFSDCSYWQPRRTPAWLLASETTGLAWADVGGAILADLSVNQSITAQLQVRLSVLADLRTVPP